MDSGVVYSKIEKSGSVRLQLRNGLNKSAADEVCKGRYDDLWLYYGNFEGMKELPVENISGNVRFQSSESQDVSWIGRMKLINSLSLKGKVKGNIDFSKMNSLKEVDLEWSGATKKIITSSLNLNRINLNKFSGRLLDFSEEIIFSVSEMGLSGSMEDLKGVGRFKKLRSLSLWNMKKLKDISDLKRCTGLKVFHIEGCNNVESEEVLKDLCNLEELFYENHQVESVSCFPVSSLRRLVLGNQTVIVKGDVEGLLSFPKLEKVSFSKKKNYQFSAEEINSKLQSTS